MSSRRSLDSERLATGDPQRLAPVLFKDPLETCVPVVEAGHHLGKDLLNLCLRELQDPIDHGPDAGFVAEVERPRDHPGTVADKLDRQTFDWHQISKLAAVRGSSWQFNPWVKRSVRGPRRRVPNPHQ